MLYYPTMYYPNHSVVEHAVAPGTAAWGGIGEGGVIDGRLILPRPSPLNVTSFPRPRIIVASEPRHDMLGSFLLPSVYLLSIARRYGWEMEIIPYEGSKGEKSLRENFRLGHDIAPDWGTGMIDASGREGYNPMELNSGAHTNMGIFGGQQSYNRSSDTTCHPTEEKWIYMEEIPDPDSPEIHELCKGKVKRCKLCVPFIPKTFNGQQVFVVQDHIARNGGAGAFFTPYFRTTMHREFMLKNQHRLHHYVGGGYNVAVHVRRGDISNIPYRWMDQSVYAAVVRRICAGRKSRGGDRGGEGDDVDVHIFSSGKNTDGNWNVLTSVADGGAPGGCRSVSVHLDEYEFDTYAHLVSADALVLSKSTFSHVPALLNVRGEIHIPTYYHLCLPGWREFDANTGDQLKVC